MLITRKGARFRKKYIQYLLFVQNSCLIAITSFMFQLFAIYFFRFESNCSISAAARAGAERNIVFLLLFL